MERDRMCYWALSKGSPRYDVFATWEERAFTEHSAGDLGSIWPPRSYSCSFCGREFSSAQALGGHMNVHRRDRARLKQSQSSRQRDDEAQIATDHRCKDRRLPSSPISSRLDLDRGTLPRVSSWSLISDKRSAVLGDQMLASSSYWSPLGRKHGENKGMSSLVSSSLVYPTIVKGMKNLSNTNRGNKLRCIDNSEKYSIDETTSFKRAKISDSRTLPRFTFCRYFTEDCLHKSEVSIVKVGPREELDLELRLGSPSEVK